MEDITHMVATSFDRHGFIPGLDHRRLQWSKWTRCESGLSVLLAPGKPGIFALAEEQDLGINPLSAEKRLLNLFQISQTGDLGLALGRMFLPGAPGRERITAGKCYVRYCVIEDAEQRHAGYRALSEWMVSSTESRSEIPNNLTVHAFAKDPAASVQTEALPFAPTGT